MPAPDMKSTVSWRQWGWGLLRTQLGGGRGGASFYTFSKVCYLHKDYVKLLEEIFPKPTAHSQQSFFPLRQSQKPARVWVDVEGHRGLKKYIFIFVWHFRHRYHPAVIVDSPKVFPALILNFFPQFILFFLTLINPRKTFRTTGSQPIQPLYTGCTRKLKEPPPLAFLTVNVEPPSYRAASDGARHTQVEIEEMKSKWSANSHAGQAVLYKW